MENLIIEEICKKTNKSYKLVNLLVKICKDNGITNRNKIIKKVCQKVCQNKNIII